MNLACLWPLFQLLLKVCLSATVDDEVHLVVEPWPMHRVPKPSDSLTKWRAAG